MKQTLTVAELADEIVRARDGIVEVARRCPPEQWRSRLLEGDERPLGVVVDHVAHAYEYLGGWVRELLDGQVVEVTPEIVDALNARHAVSAAEATVDEAIGHLRNSGDELAALMRSLSAADLERGDGRVRRFALIAIRHADNHGAEITAALAGPAAGGVQSRPARPALDPI